MATPGPGVSFGLPGDKLGTESVESGGDAWQLAKVVIAVSKRSRVRGGCTLMKQLGAMHNARRHGGGLSWSSTRRGV